MVAAAIAGPVSAAGATDMHGMPGMQHDGGAVPRHHATATMPGFKVGTDEHPLLADGPSGPLWAATKPLPPGRATHGTFAEITVAEEIAKAAALRAASDGRPGSATRAASTSTVLTTAQATKTLSKTCQKLLKAKTSKLGKKDRTRRAACLKKRRALVAASKVAAQPTTPGVSAPAGPIQGPTPVAGTAPAPTPAPAAGAPTPTPPTDGGSVPAPTPTPAPTTTGGPVYGAITARARDTPTLQPFQLSRATVAADIVAFGLENNDRQNHNLSIVATDTNGNPVGSPTVIVGDAKPDEKLYRDVALSPGTYKLLCMVAGHGAMTVAITVTAPPAN